MGAGEPVVGSEGVAKLSRTQLGWRLAGRASALPAVVFENGWSASWQQWTLVEPLLAPHTQLLFYDRAGIGASAPGRSADAASLSRDLAELLASLNVKQPVVLVGQSYGGLMAGLHAAQIPSQVCGIVQLDPTPEIDDTLIDQQLRFFRKVGAASVWLARLGLRNPLFSALWEHFPEREARLLEQRAYLSPESLRGALHELGLVSAIRAAISAGLAARRQPRLLISAGAIAMPEGRIAKALLPERRLRQTLERMQALHEAQTARGEGGLCERAESHTHGGLVSTPAGAQYSAGRILAFLHEIGRKA